MAYNVFGGTLNPAQSNPIRQNSPVFNWGSWLTHVDL